MERAPTIILAGGGTGGHLMPGIALAEELRARNPAIRVIAAGSDRPVEKQLVEQAAMEHHALPAQSLTTARRSPLQFLRHNWRALKLARRLIQDTQPKAIVGLGGFASVPVVAAGWKLGVPTLLLEQNLIPGRATRWLSRLATTVCLSFEGTHSLLPRRAVTVVTGNPVRSSIAALYGQSDTPQDSNGPLLLILGGSQGAVALNEAVLSVIEGDRELFADWRIVHQTGQQHLDEVRRRYSSRHREAVVEPFFSDLCPWYREASLVISRSGATTLAELAIAGCPSVLVPYPHAADNHQSANARHFANAGASVVVFQRPSRMETTRMLAESLRGLVRHPERLSRMSRAAHALGKPDAAKRVADVLDAMVK